MMISPETYYKENLKGKTKKQIMTVIRSLKQEIGRLKNIVEHPDYVCTMCPSEQVRISCYRDYLERAKLAFIEAGGNYAPSASEKKAMEFDANIQFISKVVLHIGGQLTGYETRTYTIHGDKVYADFEHSLIIKPSNISDDNVGSMDKDYFLEKLKALHIGEWRKHYDTSRFSIVILDGTQWCLEIYFSNGYKTVKIQGDNSFPYNFDRLLDIFEAEEI